MARTIDHLGGGRFILGIGSGWFERDYTEYGYEFGTAIGRLRDLQRDLPRMRVATRRTRHPRRSGRFRSSSVEAARRSRFGLVAEHADAWNTFGPPETWAHKNRVLDEWCEQVGRDPRAIERTVAIEPKEVERVEAYAEVGVDHIIVMIGAPFDLGPALEAKARLT